jgi:hypothetical protein
MIDDNPLSTRYHGVATLEQFVAMIKSNASVRRPTATIARGIINKSSLYDVLRDPDVVKVQTLKRFCEAYDVDLVVAVRRKA